MRTRAAIAGTVVLVAFIVGAVFTFRGTTPYERPRASGSKPPTAASPATRPAPPPSPGRAKSPVSLNEILAGILLLEESPHPLSRDQALQVSQAWGGQSPDMMKGAWLTAQAAEVLTAEQKAFLESRSRFFPPPSPAARKAFLDTIKGLAKMDAVEAITIPADPATLECANKHPAEYLSLLVTYSQPLQDELGLALTAEQAKRLAPICQAYVSLNTRIEDVLLALLTQAQRDYISARVRDSEVVRADMDTLGRKVRELSAERSRS